MREPLLRRLPLLLLVACIGGCVIMQAAAATLPAKVQGHWEVIQVAVDQDDQPHWQYFPNDPRLLGRQLIVDDAGVRLDDGTPACAHPTVTALPASTLQSFIGHRFSRPASFDRPPRPTLAEFDIKIPDVHVAPLQLGCQPTASPWNGAWLVPAPGRRLLTNYDNGGYVLILRKLSSAEPIQASFACTKALSATERAICASSSLAAYDRSVAAAYRFALQRAGDDTKALRQDQRQWIATRNACAGDAGCLAERMRERTNQLMQQ
jgi:uncharacterized protein YecT (DUF1311 family)